MTRLTRTLAPAALMVAVAGAAQAQFVREGSVQSTPAAASNARSVQTVTEIDNGRRFELRIENDEIVYARVDGKDWPKDRISRKPGVVALFGEGGEEVHRFELGVTAPSAVQAAPLRRGARVLAPAAPAAPAAPGAMQTITITAVETPKVMIGVRFSEPGEALRTHLGLADGTEAFIIDDVVKGLPADRAGLRKHDVVVSINGSDGASGDMLREVLQSASPGDQVELTVLRGSERLNLTIELAAYDGEALGSTGMQVTVVPTIPGTPGTPALSEQDMAWTARDHAKMMQDLAERLSRDAARQMLELRDGRLFVRSAEEIDEQMRALREELDAGAGRARPELEARLRRMEERMEEFERAFDARMDRLQALMDRMSERLERRERRRDDD